MSFQGVVLALFSLSLHAPIGVEGHGYLFSPRSRNVYAHDVISNGECLGQAGCPPDEYCPHCLNANKGVCGKSPTQNYETSTWLDKNGDPMPWRSQHKYFEGDIILVGSYLDTNHNGHQELWACAMDDNDPTMCSEPEHFEGKELKFVRELVTEGSHPAMPDDPNYPERGMYGGGQAGGSKKKYSHEYRLPEGVSGDRVLLRWKYITANACSPPGYPKYFSKNPNLNSYWSPGLEECTPPYPEDGTRNATSPEQFFNCAEITVIPTTPTTSPPLPPSSTTGGPTASTTPAVVGPPTCIAEWKDCTDDWQGCCDGLKCTQVNEDNKRLCLEDTCTCDDGPAPPSVAPPTHPTNPPLPPTNPPGMPPSPTPPPAPTCTVCDDRETNVMISKGYDCATDTIRINSRCNKSANWRQNKWCRLSCYNAGNGYPGDVCCGVATPDTLGRKLAAASGATKRAAFPTESQYLE